MNTLSIDVWSDVVCPWCYIGRRRLAAALDEFSRRASAQVTWHAFELDPEAARGPSDPGAAIPSHAERLAAKYRINVPEARQRTAQVTALGQQEGLDLKFDRVRPANSFDAHRVLQFARARGAAIQDAVNERLFRAHFTEGEAIDDRQVLERLAGEAGLDGTEVGRMLASTDYAAEVRADELMARRSGIAGVPFFVFDNTLAVSGAHPAEVLLAAMNQAWSSRSEGDAEPGSAAAIIGASDG